MKLIQNKKTLFLFLAIVFCGVFGFSFVSADELGDVNNFYIDSNYDSLSRKKIEAVLEKISDKLYFYIDQEWWSGLRKAEKNKVKKSINQLADEFESNIYPTLTSNYGLDARPGIDNDNHTVILIHPMTNKAGGYFNTGNGYSRFEVPGSNEREMVYLNAEYITQSIVKSYLAHEFTHVITFNQKNNAYDLEEEVWLNEARAEYAPTLCGYDSEYVGSNLERRVNEFLRKPSNSITHWDNSFADYGVLNIFTQYLVDHYGVKILKDSLQSPKRGIHSLNDALKKNGFDQDFAQIFTDWTIASLVNNCSFGDKYCYLNNNLKNVRVTPVSNFLPIKLETALSSRHTTKEWTGNWYKIFGGAGTLVFKFDGAPSENSEMPYLICDNSDTCSLYFLPLDNDRNGQIIIEGFNKEYISLYIIPSVQHNGRILSDFSFSWEAKIDIDDQKDRGGEQDPGDQDSELIAKLLSQIAQLREQIAQVQAKIDIVLKNRAYVGINGNLYFGLKNSPEVKSLQEFLKNQGPGIYPEGLITGNFLDLTRQAVARFQERYAQDILSPLGLNNGTGYVGKRTRDKINELIR